MGKKIERFKEGESIPDGAKFLYAKTFKENYRESNWTWCGCPDMLRCDCATWESNTYHYYEVPEELNQGDRDE